MNFRRRALGQPDTLVVFAGAFHPPTVAHVAMARAALAVADEVLLVLPERFPHKPWEGASLEQRVAWLEAAIAGEPRFSLAVSPAGLFLDIARHCRAAYGPSTRLLFLCGRDAAERIVHWDYGAREPFAVQLREFELLVAARQGEYVPPPDLAPRIHSLAMPSSFDEVSSTAVRERRSAGLPWRHLVPPEIVPLLE